MQAANKTVAQRPALPSRAGLKVVAVQRPQVPAKAQLADAKAVAATLGSAVLLQAGAAAASEPIVDTTVDSVVSAVKSTGDFVNSGITTVQSGLQVLKQGFDIVAPVAQQAIDAVSPVVVDVSKTAAGLAAPAINAAGPAVSSTVTTALKSTGVDLNTVSKTVSTATSAASSASQQVAPVASKVVEFLTTTDPTVLGEYALGAAALYYVVPAVLGSLKGYQGSITATAALDQLATDGNTVLIDLRVSREKEQSGVTDVPGSASGRVIEVEYAALEDKKLRGLLRDPAYIEAQTTALQVAALKKISKGTKVVLLDRYGPVSETVARELSKKGFGKVYVVSGGFDGRGGWVQSKLQIKPYTSATGAFAAPSFARGGTMGTNRKSLPAPKA